MSNGPMDYTCPVCAAPPGERCRTLATRRSTDMHVARMDAPAAEAARRAGRS